MNEGVEDTDEYKFIQSIQLRLHSEYHRIADEFDSEEFKTWAVALVQLASNVRPKLGLHAHGFYIKGFGCASFVISVYTHVTNWVNVFVYTVEVPEEKIDWAKEGF